jgi:hypothetical protein
MVYQGENIMRLMKCETMQFFEKTALVSSFTGNGPEPLKERFFDRFFDCRSDCRKKPSQCFFTLGAAEGGFIKNGKERKGKKMTIITCKKTS